MDAMEWTHFDVEVVSKFITVIKHRDKQIGKMVEDYRIISIPGTTDYRIETPPVTPAQEDKPHGVH